MCHLDRLQGKMSPGDSNDPLDKCSLSHHLRAWLTLLLLNSNTLKTRRDTNTGHKIHPEMSIKIKAFHTLIQSILKNTIRLHTTTTNTGGLVESGAVAVLSWRAEPTGRKVLGPHNTAPSSYRARVLLGKHGSWWTDKACRTHIPCGHGNL